MLISTEIGSLVTAGKEENNPIIGAGIWNIRYKCKIPQPQLAVDLRNCTNIEILTLSQT